MASFDGEAALRAAASVSRSPPASSAKGSTSSSTGPSGWSSPWGWTDPGFGLEPGTSRVQVTLARVGEDGQQTRLRLIHTGLAGDLGLLHDDGWTRFLARLASVKAGGEPPAYPAEQPAGRLITLRGQRARKDSP